MILITNDAGTTQYGTKQCRMGQEHIPSYWEDFLPVKVIFSYKVIYAVKKLKPWQAFREPVADEPQ